MITHQETKTKNEKDYIMILLFQRTGTITGGFNFYFGQSYQQAFNFQLKEQVNVSLSYSKYNRLDQQLTIKAQDLGSPSLSSEKTITVALKNINDNSPIFVEVRIQIQIQIRQTANY